MQPSLPSISSEASLRQELYARTLEVDEPPRFPADANHRWRLASAMQKSIRRGHTHCATKVAVMLHSIDPQYAWRRLAIIAMEDCFGDPLACALTLEANRSFRFRQRLGELQTLAAIVTGLSECVKSRALTDSLVKRGKGYHYPSAKELKAHAQLQEAPWLVTYLALRGTVHAKLGYEVPRVWPMLADAEVVEREPDPFGDELISGLPAAAYCGLYTSEGQRTMRYLAKCPPFRLYRPPQIGLALWFVEGAFLDRSLASADLASLELQAKLMDWNSVDADAAQAVELVELITRHRELVNRVRKNVLRT